MTMAGNSAGLGRVFLLGVGLGGLVAGAGVWWFEGGLPVGALGSPSYIQDDALPVTLRRGEVGDALLGVARSVFDGGPPVEADVLGTLPVHPVTVCAYEAPRAPTCRRVETGPTLAAVVASAAQAARAAGGQGPRLSVDVEVLDTQVDWAEPGHRKRDPGVWGYRAGGAVLPPSHVLTSTVYGGGEEDKSFRGDVLRSELARRMPSEERVADITALPLHRFRTVSWVEDGSGGSLHVFRVHGFERPSVAVDVLARRAAWAADHLASTVGPDGRVRYLFDVPKGVERPGYNMLRHGGTTYSLLQAYQRFEHEPWLRAAEGAIGFLLSNSRRDVRHGPFGGGEVLWVNESRHIKLGGAGLALVMMTQHMQATGSDEHLEDARAYARFLVSQQLETGEFVYFANQTPGGPPRDRTSAYYPGEALLGLAQLYALDPDPLWLDTATRGADWLIDVRDAGKGPKQLANDHWLMIALSHLVKHTDDPRYVTHSLALADAVAYQADRNRHKVATHPDYFGGYYDPPRSTPAATRGEGLVAVLDTCAMVDRECPEVLQMLRETVTHELWSQYTPATCWWMPRPGAVVGGFSGGIMDLDLRNDFTQHNLSSVLGTERHLRGGVLPGGPLWSFALQDTFEPSDTAGMDELLQPLRSIRGSHKWDAVEPVGIGVDGDTEPPRHP